MNIDANERIMLLAAINTLIGQLYSDCGKLITQSETEPNPPRRKALQVQYDILIDQLHRASDLRRKVEGLAT